MKLMLCCLLGLLPVLVAFDASALPQETGSMVTLRCRLTNNPPRHGGHIPDTFTQHFRINFAEGTVDGRKAVITADQIGWEPSQAYLRPHAILLRPGWQYHSARQIGTEAYEVNGSCVEKK